MMIKAARGDQLDCDAAHAFVERAVQQLDAAPHELLRLSRYERYDAFTFGHSIRVGLLAIHFAKTLTSDPEFLFRIGVAALMHDIGKAKVPFEILHSTGVLDPEQRAAMNRHTEHGGRILLDMQGVEPMAIAAALGHHQTLAGGGYPVTLHRTQLSTCTRMIKICDVYEALTAVRPYKDRMSPARAYRIMISMRDHFDQALLKWFIYVNGIYPVGSNVLLSTGELAVVVEHTAELDQPIVALEKDTNRAGARLDLSRQTGSERAAIRELVYEPAA
jgi:HD-GYP domain-containing protein (c-di-GMP phosphodiesterase class II)